MAGLDLEALTRWAWYGVTAVFFGVVRSVIRQEYRSPAQLLLVTLISFGCAMFTAMIMQELKYPQWAIYSGVAMATLISSDLLKIVLNFTDLASKDKGYLGRLLTSVVKVTVPQPGKDDPPKEPGE